MQADSKAKKIVRSGKGLTAEELFPFKWTWIIVNE